MTSQRRPGLRLHPRTMPVQRAYAELGELLLEWETRHELTPIEAAMGMTEQLQRLLKYELRGERHPDDPDHKADEE